MTTKLINVPILKGDLLNKNKNLDKLDHLFKRNRETKKIYIYFYFFIKNLKKSGLISEKISLRTPQKPSPIPLYQISKL